MQWSKVDLIEFDKCLEGEDYSMPVGVVMREYNEDPSGQLSDKAKVWVSARWPSKHGFVAWFVPL